MKENKILELWIGVLGLGVGVMLGIWLLIEIVKLGISK